MCVGGGGVMLTRYSCDQDSLLAYTLAMAAKVG